MAVWLSRLEAQPCCSKDRGLGASQSGSETLRRPSLTPFAKMSAAGAFYPAQALHNEPDLRLIFHVGVDDFWTVVPNLFSAVYLFLLCSNFALLIYFFSCSIAEWIEYQGTPTVGNPPSQTSGEGQRTQGLDEECGVPKKGMPQESNVGWRKENSNPWRTLEEPTYRLNKYTLETSDFRYLCCLNLYLYEWEANARNCQLPCLHISPWRMGNL